MEFYLDTSTLQYILLAAVGIAALSIGLPGLVGAVWLPTPAKDIDNLLKSAGLKEGDVLYDLGCGDGRVLIHAAREFGARGVGVDINPLKTFIARMRVKFAGLDDKIRIVTGPAGSIDLRDADVVFCYLSHQANDRLEKKFLSELKESAVIVSYHFMIRGFKPSSVYDKGKGFIYKIALGRNLDRLG